MGYLEGKQTKNKRIDFKCLIRERKMEWDWYVWRWFESSFLSFHFRNFSQQPTRDEEEATLIIALPILFWHNKYVFTFSTLVVGISTFFLFVPSFIFFSFFHNIRPSIYIFSRISFWSHCRVVVKIGFIEATFSWELHFLTTLPISLWEFMPFV